MSQYRPGLGYVGTLSNMTVVVPLHSGPYTMYEWPVIHPASATHAWMSPSRRSNTYLVVMAAYRR